MSDTLKRSSLLLSEEERHILKQVAKAEGMLELSNLIRVLVREGLERRQVNLPEMAFTKKHEGRPRKSITTKEYSK